MLVKNAFGNVNDHIQQNVKGANRIANVVAIIALTVFGMSLVGLSAYAFHYWINVVGFTSDTPWIGAALVCPQAGLSAFILAGMILNALIRHRDPKTPSPIENL